MATGRSISMWGLMDVRVAALATGNVGGAVANNLVANVDPIMHLLVAAGQVAVAIVTVIYIIKKIKSLPKKDKDAKD